MKNTFYCSSLIFLILITSCKKIDQSSTAVTDIMAGRVASVTDNMQTKYGIFSGSATIQGVFRPSLNTKSFKIGDYIVGKTLTGMYYGETGSDLRLAEKFISLYGKSLTVEINGEKIPNIPAVPYANYMTLNKDLENWTISKTKGLTLEWKVRNLIVANNGSGASGTPQVSYMMNIDSTNLAQQVPNSKTTISIIPDHLQNSGAKSLYFIVDENAKSFTINPSALSAFKNNEEVNISICSSTELVYNSNGNKIDILSMNTTYLPNLVVVP